MPYAHQKSVPALQIPDLTQMTNSTPIFLSTPQSPAAPLSVHEAILTLISSFETRMKENFDENYKILKSLMVIVESILMTFEPHSRLLREEIEANDTASSTLQGYFERIQNFLEAKGKRPPSENGDEVERSVEERFSKLCPQQPAGKRCPGKAGMKAIRKSAEEEFEVEEPEAEESEAEESSSSSPKKIPAEERGKEAEARAECQCSRCKSKAKGKASAEQENVAPKKARSKEVVPTPTSTKASSSSASTSKKRKASDIAHDDVQSHVDMKSICERLARKTGDKRCHKYKGVAPNLTLRAICGTLELDTKGTKAALLNRIIMDQKGRRERGWKPVELYLKKNTKKFLENFGKCQAARDYKVHYDKILRDSQRNGPVSSKRRRRSTPESKVVPVDDLSESENDESESDFEAEEEQVLVVRAPVQEVKENEPEAGEVATLDVEEPKPAENVEFEAELDNLAFTEATGGSIHLQEDRHSIVEVNINNESVTSQGLQPDRLSASNTPAVYISAEDQAVFDAMIAEATGHSGIETVVQEDRNIPVEFDTTSEPTISQEMQPNPLSASNPPAVLISAEDQGAFDGMIAEAPEPTGMEIDVQEDRNIPVKVNIANEPVTSQGLQRDFFLASNPTAVLISAEDQTAFDAVRAEATEVTCMEIDVREDIDTTASEPTISQEIQPSPSASNPSASIISAETQAAFDTLMASFDDGTNLDPEFWNFENMDSSGEERDIDMNLTLLEDFNFSLPFQ